MGHGGSWTSHSALGMFADATEQLLYLHQALPEIPTESSAEIAKRVLVFLATVPLASRTVIVHIYPLMMAGCEVTSDEDRQWVKDRWSALSQRMRIGPIDKCLEVTREVWRRRDNYENSPMRRRNLVSTSLGDGRPRSYQEHADGVDERFPLPAGRRRMTVNDIGRPDLSVPSHNPRPRQRASINGRMDPAYGVKGKLHWIGVMMDWGWEGEFLKLSLSWKRQLIVLQYFSVSGRGEEGGGVSYDKQSLGNRGMSFIITTCTIFFSRKLQRVETPFLTCSFYMTSA